MDVKVRRLVKFLKRNEFVWRYGLNLSPTLSYHARSRAKLSEMERKLAESLDKDGIAVSSVDEIFLEKKVLAFFETAVSELLKNNQDEICDLKTRSVDGAVGHKTFNMEMVGSEILFDPQDIFAAMALNTSLLAVANAYFRMQTKLRYYNVWYTVASTSAARESQLWHFDREDNYILKVFLYLDDIGEGAGPFTYAPGTHKKGRFRSIKPEYFKEGDVQRTTDEQMAAVYPREKWKVCTGRKGTIIFADTRGYHKGGEARTKDRLMFTCMYTSPASESKELIKFPDKFDRGSLSQIQLRALGLR